MFTHLTRLGGITVLGITLLGGQSSRALAQDAPAQPAFRVNQGQPAAGSGVRAYAPGTGGGFNVGAPGLPGGSYGMITSSPFSGITSTPYSPEGRAPAYGYGNYSYADPYGGYLQGAASVISAEGQYNIDSQKAYLLKEQVRSAQMENRRRMFDEWLYERANTPTLQDELERIQKQELRRSRFDPPRTEIWSAKALNDILEDLKRVDRSKVPGGNSVVDEDVLKKINVTSGKGNINLGVLKNNGVLEWPLALRDPSLGKTAGEMRTQISSLVKAAYANAKENGQPDANAITEIRGSITRLEGEMRNHSNELGFSQYTEAKNYLRPVDRGRQSAGGPQCVRVRQRQVFAVQSEGWQYGRRGREVHAGQRPAIRPRRGRRTGGLHRPASGPGELRHRRRLAPRSAAVIGGSDKARGVSPPVEPAPPAGSRRAPLSKRHTGTTP